MSRLSASASASGASLGRQITSQLDSTEPWPRYVPRSVTLNLLADLAAPASTQTRTTPFWYPVTRRPPSSDCTPERSRQLTRMLSLLSSSPTLLGAAMDEYTSSPRSVPTSASKPTFQNRISPLMSLVARMASHADHVILCTHALCPRSALSGRLSPCTSSLMAKISASLASKATARRSPSGLQETDRTSARSAVVTFTSRSSSSFSL
mmetsp:Transcript_46413/g.145227  ORF Transcript_46413/g.145227 Transcript_46413/m.145227 type:complete len:208 (-) Transcript_46413:729-1352(-)